MASLGSEVAEQMDEIFSKKGEACSALSFSLEHSAVGF